MNENYFDKNLSIDKLNLLIKKAVMESDNTHTRKPFNPKSYLDGKINPFICNHEVFLKSDSIHVCAICGFSLFYEDNIPNSVEFISYNRETEIFIKLLLKLISYQYLDKEHIDITNIFRQLEPNIDLVLREFEKLKKEKINNYIVSNDSENIANLLKDFRYEKSKTEEVLRKYEDLLKSDDQIKIRKKEI